MRVYICANYERREEMRRVAGELVLLNHLVTSRWLHWEDYLPDHGFNPFIASVCAETDLADIRRADALTIWLEPRGTSSRGGRHVEFGYALALQKRIFIIGEHAENIFHQASGCTWFETTRQFLDEMRSHDRL